VVWSTNVDIMTNDKPSELTSPVQREKPDVVALCEVKNKRPNIIWNDAQFNIPGYDMVGHI
jgi:hypothetical protein